MRLNAVVKVLWSFAVVVLGCSVLLAAGAFAAKPKDGARFKGHTGRAPVEGFLAPVDFKVAPNGSGLYNFTFGSFGCFGVGGFRPGVNPYKGGSLIDAGLVKVKANGRFSQKALSSYSIAGYTTLTSMTIAGRFPTAKTVTGTITFSQTVSPSKASCGPTTLSFTASA
jgi:hypothetical protein